MRSIILAAFIAMPITASAYTFTSDEDIIVLRFYDYYGDTRVDLLGDDLEGVPCVAYDKDMKPIASDTALGNSRMVQFWSLDVSTVHGVACERR